MVWASTTDGCERLPALRLDALAVRLTEPTKAADYLGGDVAGPYRLTATAAEPPARPAVERTGRREPRTRGLAGAVPSRWLAWLELSRGWGCGAAVGVNCTDGLGWRTSAQGF